MHHGLSQAPARQPQPAQPRILIIDDDAALASTLAERLVMSGFQVTTAPDGETGIRAATKEKPDLILGDVGLPGIDGFEVFDRLRSDPDWNGTPFLFLTAATQERDLRRGMNLGADDYLCKPIAWSDLLAAITVRLARHRQEQDRARRLQDGIVDVLTGFAHDIRGPLFALGTSADLMRQTKSAASADENDQILDHMKSMVARLHTMSSDLLTYSKSRLAATPLSCSWTNASSLLARARLDCSQPERISVLPPQKALRLWCDDILIRQTLRNLLENALKFTPQASPKITLGCRATEGWTELWVEDQGKGIPAADLPYIFEPFWRGTNAVGSKGSGFGLAIAQSHVLRHRGSLSATSVEGKGARFTIRIPKTPPKGAHGTAPAKTRIVP